MDSGQRRRSARTGREGQADVRHGRYVADLAADARRGACDGREQCVAHDAFQHPHPAVGRGAAGAVRHSGFDDARGEVVERGVRSDQDHDFRAQGAHRGNCGRPAGGPVRADVRRAGVGEEHVRHGVLPADEQRREADRLGEQPADDDRMEDRRQGQLRPRREHLRRRLGRTVAARRAGDHPLVVGNRGAGGVGARHQRRLFRARADGACGPVLGPVCAGRDKRHQPRHDGGAYRAGGAGRDCLSDARHRRGHAARFGHHAPGAESGRRRATTC